MKITNFYIDLKDGTRIFPIFSPVDKELMYHASADQKILFLEVSEALRRRLTIMANRNWDSREVQRLLDFQNEKNILMYNKEYIHSHFEIDKPDFHDKVESLILSAHRGSILFLDARRLREVFPSLNEIICQESITIENAGEEIRVSRFNG